MPLLEFPWRDKPPPGTPLDPRKKNNIIVYFALDEGGGSDVRDQSGGRNNGVFVNTPSWIGGALDFDFGDYVDMNPVLANYSGNISTLLIRMKVRNWDVFGATPWSTTSAAVYWQFHGPADNIYIMRTEIAGVGITNHDDNTYRNYACVSDGSSVFFYINGVLAGSGGAGTSIGSGIKAFALGDWASNPGVSWSLDGSIDQLVFYDTALTVAEIQAWDANPWHVHEPRLIPFGAVAAAGVSPSPRTGIFGPVLGPLRGPV